MKYQSSVVKARYANSRGTIRITSVDAWTGRALNMDRGRQPLRAQLGTRETDLSFIHRPWYKEYINRSGSGGMEDASKKFRFWHDEKRFKVRQISNGRPIMRSFKKYFVQGIKQVNTRKSWGIPTMVY